MTRAIHISELLDGLTTGMFHLSRSDALRIGICVRCQQQVLPFDLEPVDRSEYAISGMCPECWTAVMGDEE